MMNFTFEKSGDVGILTFDGELDAGRIDELKAALMLSMNNAGHIILNFEKVTRLDDSCFKLLCSAHQISAKLNKRMTFASFSPHIFKYPMNAEANDYFHSFNIRTGNPGPVSGNAVMHRTN